MTIEVNKTEDRISKEKEAVKAMTGARQAMAEALNRIERLEKTLNLVRQGVKEISNELKGELYIALYDVPQGRRVPKKLSEAFSGIDKKIIEVL